MSKVIHSVNGLKVTRTDNPTVYKVESDAKDEHVIFQDGNPAEVGVNGLTNEAMIAIVIDRIEKQNAIVSSVENEKALECLRAGKGALESRIRDRQKRGVLGTSKA